MKPKTKRRVVVTGGAGFIGSNLVDFLLSEHWEVTVIDDLTSGHRAFVNNQAKLQVLDINSQEAADVLVAFRPHAVVHLAAQIKVESSIKDPRRDAQVNVMGTLNMLIAARRTCVDSFIAISSGGALYGDADSIPTSESNSIAPLSPYGASKYCSEVYLDLACRTSTMRCVSLRLSNVYGPRQSLYGEAGVVAIFVKKLLKREPLTIFGDGHQTRDFVYVKDVCSAIYACLTSQEARGPFNIGTGTQTTISGLLAMLQTLCNSRQSVRYERGVKDEVRYSALCSMKALRVFDWKPLTGLEDGLKETVSYMHAAQHLSAPSTHFFSRSDSNVST